MRSNTNLCKSGLNLKVNSYHSCVDCLRNINGEMWVGGADWHILILIATSWYSGEVALSKMRCSRAITFESGTQSGQVTGAPLHL